MCRMFKWTIAAWCAIGMFPPAAIAGCDAVLIASVKNRFPDWVIVTQRNYSQDEHGHITELHPSDCAGIVQGNFESKSSHGFAMIISKGFPDGTHEMPLVASPDRGHYKISVLDESSGLFSLSRVSKLPAGEYESSDGRTFSVRGESIVYEGSGTGARLFFFERGKYRSESIRD